MHNSINNIPFLFENNPPQKNTPYLIYICVSLRRSKKEYTPSSQIGSLGRGKRRLGRETRVQEEQEDRDRERLREEDKEKGRKTHRERQNRNTKNRHKSTWLGGSHRCKCTHRERKASARRSQHTETSPLRQSTRHIYPPGVPLPELSCSCSVPKGEGHGKRDKVNRDGLPH